MFLSDTSLLYWATAQITTMATIATAMRIPISMGYSLALWMNIMPELASSQTSFGSSVMESMVVTFMVMPPGI